MANWQALKDKFNNPANANALRTLSGVSPAYNFIAKPVMDFVGGEKTQDSVEPEGSPIDLVAGAAGGALGSAMAADAGTVVGNEVGSISGNLKANKKIRDLANSYMEAKGLSDVERPYTKVNPDTAKQYAQAFEQMPHTPNSPEVKEAYDALIKETLDQYKNLKNTGIKIDKITPDMKNPYPNGSKDLIADINSGHMYYLPTESGFGSQETLSHPLLAETSEIINGEPAKANDIFRIVHDFFGHGKEGLTFGPHGEENAFLEHRNMYSPLAQKALATETRGQNSWVNFGPKAEANRADPANTIFAAQKAGLLPDWMSAPNLEQAESAVTGPQFLDLKKKLGGQ